MTRATITTKAATSSRKFKVTFFYGSRERSAVVESQTPERAAVDALLKRILPAELTPRGPLYWVPDWSVPGKTEWPEVRHTEVPPTLVWGDEDNAHSVLYSVEEISS